MPESVTPAETAATKILFVIGTLDVGGTEKQLVELATRLNRSKFEAVVCCLASAGPLASRLRADGIKVHALAVTESRWRRLRYPNRAANAWRMFSRVWTLIRKERPGIVHGMLFWAYVFGAFAARAAGVPVIIASRRSLGLFKADKPVYLFLERIADRITDLFIANSAAVRADTIAREGVCPSDIIVIRNGLDLARFEVTPDPELAASLNLADGPRVIVVSNLIAYKGHEYFLRAWREVVDRFPSAVVVLVGDGVLRSDLERLADDLHIRHSVRFLGVRHDVPALLALSDIYVHPSLQEGFSNALLEAMAAGKAVVATAVGGNVEAVSNGVTGVLVPPADSAALASALTTLLADPPAARRMGELARRHARDTYEIGAMVRAYESVYTHLLSSRRDHLDVDEATHSGPGLPARRRD